MSALIAAALRHPVGTIMIFMGAMILGLAAAVNLRLELLPELAIPRLTVSTAPQGFRPPRLDLSSPFLWRISLHP